MHIYAEKILNAKDDWIRKNVKRINDEIWYQEIDTGSIKLKKFTKSYKS